MAISDSALAVRCVSYDNALMLRCDVSSIRLSEDFHPRAIEHARHTQRIETTVPVVSVLIG